MLRDVASFQSRLSKIDGFGDTGDYLKTIIESKAVRTTAPAAAVNTTEPRENGEDGQEAKAEAEVGDKAEKAEETKEDGGSETKGDST